jgi:hypothetical protein
VNISGYQKEYHGCTTASHGMLLSGRLVLIRIQTSRLETKYPATSATVNSGFLMNLSREVGGKNQLWIVCFCNLKPTRHPTKEPLVGIILQFKSHLVVTLLTDSASSTQGEFINERLSTVDVIRTSSLAGIRSVKLNLKRRKVLINETTSSIWAGRIYKFP